MRHTFAAFGILASVTSASAQGTVAIPASDVDAACSRLSPPQAVAVCIRQEQAYYDDAAFSWEGLPDWRRRKLVDMVAGSVGKPYYYQTLASHARAQAELERQAHERVDPPRFQRR